MLCCIGGVCIPYTAVIPLFLLGVRWVFAKLHLYGLLPNFVAEMMNLKHMQQLDKQSSSSCCNLVNGAAKGENAEKPPCGDNAGSSSPSVVVKELESEKEFDDLLKKNEKVVVKFTATWCKPCHKIQPFYKKKCTENPEYDFLTVDVDDFETIAGKYSVAMMPTFIIVQGTTSVMGTYRGSSEPELDAFLKEHLS